MYGAGRVKALRRQGYSFTSYAYIISTLELNKMTINKRKYKHSHCSNLHESISLRILRNICLSKISLTDFFNLEDTGT